MRQLICFGIYADVVFLAFADENLEKQIQHLSVTDGHDSADVNHSDNVVRVWSWRLDHTIRFK